MQDSISVTAILSKARPGDDQSMASLLPLVYEELRVLAANQLAYGVNGGRAHSLQPTALVHEAFLKMVGSDRGWTGRDHFMAVAAIAMRQVLVDHSRKKGADKRGGGVPRSEVSISCLADDAPSRDCREVRVLQLDELLTELARSSERAARVAEMRLFGGMEQDQIARVLGVSRMTVHRDWQVARAWLAARMQDLRHA